MASTHDSFRLIALRQEAERALSSCSEHLPDGWKVSFVAYDPSDADDECSTIFLTDGSSDGTRRALDLLANDPRSSEF